LTLPDELDPDEFLDEHGREAFEELLNQAPDAWDYRYRRSVAEFGVDSLASRMRVLEAMLSLLTTSVGLAGTVRETALVGQLADRLGIAEWDVRRRLRELRAGAGATPSAGKTFAGESRVVDDDAARKQSLVSL